MDVTRFRSFAERYVIERASLFKGETEMEDAWNAVERAKTIYNHIENVAMVEAAKDLAGISGQGQVTQAGALQGSAAATGMAGKISPPPINSQSWTGRKSP